MNISNVTCVICKDHLLIERAGKLIGNVYNIYGEPRIQLNNQPADMMVHLSRTDCDIIWDTWNMMEESNATQRS